MTALGTIVAASPLDSNDASRYTGFTATADITETATFALGNTPADFGTMNTLSWTYDGRENISGGDDSEEVLVRIVNGATILAAADSGGTFQRIYLKNGSFSTTDTTRGPTAFSYVNTTANKTTWDGASVEIRRINVKNKGVDSVRPEPDYFAVTGDYTADTGPKTITASLLSITPSFPTATIDTPFQLPDWVRGWTRKIENGGSTTTTIVDKPTGVVEGDIMYAFNIHESGVMTSDTPPSGWADVGTNPYAYGGGNAHIYKKTAGASEPSTYTFTYDPGNQMVTYIVAIKGDSYAIDAEQLSVVEDVDSDGDVDQTLSGISTDATGLFAIVGNDPAAGTDPNYTNTSGMDKVDETSDTYLGAMAAWFVEDISGITSTTETFTFTDTGSDMPVLLVSVVPTSTTQNLTPSTFSPTVTLPTARLSLQITPSFLSLTPTFGTAEIKESVNLVSSLFTVTATFGTATLIQEQFLEPSVLSVTASFGTATIFSDLFIEPTLFTISTTFPAGQLDQAFTSNLVSPTITIFSPEIKETQGVTPAVVSVAFTLHAAQLNQNINPSTHQVITSFGTSTLGLYIQSATLGVSPTLGSPEISSTFAFAPATVTPTVAFGASEVEGAGTTQDVQPAPLTVVFSFPAGNLTATATLAPSVVSLTSSFGTAVLGIALQPAVLTVTSAFGNAQFDFGVSDTVLTISTSFPTASIAGDQAVSPDTLNVTVVFPFGNLSNAGTPLTPLDTEGQGIAQEMCAARSLPGDLDYLGCLNALNGGTDLDKLGALTALGATPGADLLLALEQLANDGQGPADFNELMRRWAESGNF